MENKRIAAVYVYELPEDVLIDILSWVPAKSLLRFKSVCKNWYSLILNPNFISLHRTRARLCPCVFLKRTSQLSMHLLPDQSSIHDLDLSFTRPHLDKYFTYHGSCNGLMCLSAKSKIVICNPATREYRLLPQPPFRTRGWHTSYLGFGFDSKTKDYIVVRVASFRRTACFVHKIHAYGMLADSWKEIAVMVPNHDFIADCLPCSSLDGVFYWLSYDYSTRDFIIHALNTVEGSFERKSFPLNLSSREWIHLCFLNGSPALVQHKFDDQQGETQGETLFDVWLMDEHRVKEFWTKKYTIGPLSGNQRPFAFLPKSEVLLTGPGNGQIVLYHHITQDIKEYNQFCDWPGQWFIKQVFPYAESLVSVKR